MHQLEDELLEYEAADTGEIKTVHVYFYREQPHISQKPTNDPLFAFVALLLLIIAIAALCLIPTSQAYTIQTVRVPAHMRLLSLQTTVQIVPTGIHTYPATQASGTLTIYNGSFLAESLPARFIVTTASGVEVQTDQAIAIPAGSPPASYGTATVSAHAAAPGEAGDIPTLAINQTYGSALYIKNLGAFTGGHDAYTQSYATSSDVTTALDTAREQLNAKQPAGLTTGPCSEKVARSALTLSLVWSCSYVTYQVPEGAQIVSVHVLGNVVLLSIRTAKHPTLLHVVR